MISQINKGEKSLTQDHSGKKFVLWEAEYKNAAYKDQFDIFHPGHLVTAEYQVTIVGRDPSEDDLWRAIGTTGEEFLAMPTVNSWMWVKVTPPRAGVQDACNCYNIYMIPYLDEKGERRFPTGATLCEKHNFAFTNGNPCYHCTVERFIAKHPVVSAS